MGVYTIVSEYNKVTINSDLTTAKMEASNYCSKWKENVQLLDNKGSVLQTCYISLLARVQP